MKIYKISQSSEFSPQILWKNVSVDKMDYDKFDERGVTKPNMLYRGISEEEMKAILSSGFIQSDNRGSFSNEGTNFSERWIDARSYQLVKGSEISDPSINESIGVSYIIEIPRGELNPNRADGYYKIMNKIPMDSIERIWKLYGKDETTYVQRVK